MESNLKLAQEEELRAVISIYSNHVKDLRSRRVKRLQSPHFSLKIFPLQSNSTIDDNNEGPTFEIIFKETSSYPHELPEITLINPQHLPPDALEKCEKELQNLMKESLGKEMIFEIAQQARIFLEAYRPTRHPPIPPVPPVIDSPPENDEQRIEREIKALREKHVEEEKSKRRGQAEILMNNQLKLTRFVSETIIRFDDPIHLTVRRGHILHQDIHPTIPDHISNISYICTDTDSARVYCLYEWNFVNGSDDNQSTNNEDFFAKYRQEFGLIEEDLKHLISLRHNLLCKILAFQFVNQETPPYTFRVLTEWPEASSLEVFDSCQISESLLKKIAIALCDVLSFLHSKSIVHRAINNKSIFLLPAGIKLTRTSFVRRLNDLHALFYEGQLPHTIQGSAKNDIYDMGLLLLNLATGRTHDYILDAPPSLSEEFQEFLQHCANGKSLDQLVMDPFLHRASASQTNFDRLISDQDDRETNSTQSNQEEMLVSAQSRLKSDFEVIGIVGRGGFGHVFKVQNKLDGCFYAVKQILLKSANKSVNKKITREVKFLSKLNHQNIVRYYSTWTEQMPLINANKSSITTSSATESRISSKKKPINGDSLRNALPATIPDLSSPHEFFGENESETTESTSSSTPSSDDEDGVFDVRSYVHIDDSDDMIQFDRGHNPIEKSEIFSSKKKLEEESSSSSSMNSHSDEPLQRVLFIQMEYCEGNTLKQLIDRDILQEKPSMIWMLLREILEGLKHMHLKGIIHRDLKPGNILLDSTGHAKIGDLGLATISTLSGYTETTNEMHDQTDPRSSWSMDMKDGGLVSTAVGTTFYMAPELLTGKRIAPTEKVDIYSLGITFFEMCCPFNTSMERAKMLIELRRPEIHVPDRFRQKSFTRHYALITQMLTHDLEKRPSAHTLLESNIIPFEQEEKFEQLLDHMINSTNNDVQSFYYRRTIAKLFQRKNNIARDATFDSDAQIDFNKLTTFHRDSRTYNTLRNSFIRIFERYGAFLIHLPILLPAPDIYNKNECANLKFISSTGLLVSLPFDSKVPLARFIARCVSHYGLNGLSTIKCYQIGNVYREGVTEMHPREITECGFDIVFTESTILPDAEILAVCQDVVSELHLHRERSVFIRLNHTELLRAILIYFDIPNDKIVPVLTAIQKDRFDSTNSSIAVHLIENGVNEQMANRIQKLMNADGPFDEIMTHLKGFTKGQSEKSKLLKTILDELELMVKYARAFGVNMPICLTLRFFTLNPILDVNTFEGVIFQLASIVQRKKRSTYEVYAGGGRYDPLLAQFRRPSQKTLSNDLPHIVGVSFDVERLIQIANNRMNSLTPLLTPIKQCDTVICLGNFAIELLNLRQKLVTSGIAVDTIYDLPSNLTVLDEYCDACGYTHLIYRKDDTTDESFRFRTYENGKAIADKRLFSTQIIQSYRSDSSNAVLITSNNGNMLSSSYNDAEQSMQQPTVGTPGTIAMKNAPSLSSLNSNNEVISAGAQLNIYIYLTEPIYKSVPRKKIENQVQYKLSSLSASFTSKSLIEVFVFDQPDSLLTTIISTLSIEDENQFDTSLRLILDKRSSRIQDLIRQFSDHMRELRFVKKSKLFVISSYKTDFYRFMAAFT